MSSPKISIITITYNSEKYLEQCILSIINQNYTNLEYIIIDGGSTDSTISIIEKYKDRIAVFISEPDKGISDAFNKGIRHSSGDLIGIVNSDDFMMPNVLSRVAEQYEESVDVYRGYCLVLNEETGKQRERHPNCRFSNPPIGGKICHESSFITRKRYNIVGPYNIDYKYIMDLEFFMRLYKDPNLVTKYLDVCVISFRVGGTSSSSYEVLKEERCKLIKENHGSSFDLFIYLSYHRIRSFVKKLSVF